MNQDNSGDETNRREEVNELIERCRVNEKKLADVKDRLLKVQRSLEKELKKGKSPRPPGKSGAGLNLLSKGGARRLIRYSVGGWRRVGIFHEPDHCPWAILSV
jgi:hypothetical protein